MYYSSRNSYNLHLSMMILVALVILCQIAGWPDWLLLVLYTALTVSDEVSVHYVVHVIQVN